MERRLVGGCLDLVMVDSLVQLRINKDALLIVAKMGFLEGREGG